MKNSLKVFLPVILMLLGYIWHQNSQIQDLNQRISDHVDQATLDGGIIRSSRDTVSAADFNSFAADAGIDLNVIRDDAGKHGATVTGANVTNSHTDGSTVNAVGSSRTRARSDKPATQSSQTPECPVCAPGNVPTVCPSCSECAQNRYENAEQILDLEESIGSKKVRVGEVSFKAWLDSPWSYTLLPRVFRSSAVIAEDDEGRKLVYTKSQMIVADEVVDMPVSTSQYIETPMPPKFRWNPRLALGFGAGTSTSLELDLNAGLQMNFASYGSKKLIPDWNLLGVGVLYSSLNTLEVAIFPASYRIARFLPFVENVYLGPAVGFGLSGRLVVFLNVSSNL